MEIGIDLGGTKIAAALVHKGEIVKETRIRTGKGKAEILKGLQSVIDELAPARYRGVGIGVPGYFTGTRIDLLPNLKALKGVDLAKHLTHKGKLILGNDAKVFTLAEQRFGVASDAEHVAGTTLGTGVGTGIVLDGKLWTGPKGRSPELGHVIHDTLLMRFREGQKEGDWEELLSGRGIMSAHRRRGGKERLASEIWRSSHPICRATRKEISRYLAIFCANIVRTFDPDIIVVGGGVSTPELVKETNALMKNYGCRPILRLSTLKERSGMLGAAALLG